MPPDSRGVAAPTDVSTNWLERFFGIRAKGSTVRTELLGGLSTFFALSYIFVVNPAILERAGIDKSVTLFATIVASALATLAMGLWARLPFVVSTGMEMNGYVAFFVVGVLGLTWQQALGAVFWASILMICVTLLKVRERIIDSIPLAIKVGLSFSVGVFLIMIGLSVAGLVRHDGTLQLLPANAATPGAYALAASTLLVFLLQRWRLQGAVLISILVTSAGLYALGGVPPAAPAPGLSAAMLAGVGALDLAVLLQPQAFSVIVVLFVLDFFGSVAKFIGLSLHTSILVDGKLPGRQRALLVDGVASAGAGVLGTTSMVAFVESAVGIGGGARTGLAAATTGVLMLCTLLAFPLIQAIPVAATTGALVYVGASLCPRRGHFATMRGVERLAVLAMALVTVLTFALDKAMLAGFALLVVGNAVTRQRTDRWFIGATVVLGAGVALQALA